MTTERKLQQNFLEILHKEGIFVVKTDSTSARGWPDLTAVFPNGTVVFIEVKTKTGVLSVHQKRIHDKLRERKANVYTARTPEDVEAIINAHI